MLKVTLRPVEQKDWDFILKLRNRNEFRRYFINQHRISKKEHYAYLRKQTKNPNFHNWIICYSEEDAGYVRILDNDVGIIIHPKYHNKGMGTKAIELLLKEAKKLKIKKLVARVMIENPSSMRIFRKNKFKLIMYWLEKDLKQNCV